MKIEINNHELIFDILDADNADLLQNELQRVQEFVRDIKNNNHDKLGDLIRSQCRCIFQFFNNVFGENTHEQIFGKTCNLKECIFAFNKVIKAIEKEKDDIKELMLIE